MKPNIFLYKNIKKEDHFTICLGYLLNLFPSILGNRFLEKLSVMSGNPWDYFGKFKEAEFTGHELQNINSTSKPDMIIHTTNRTIFFEHKLEAPLSKEQLERHLNDVDNVKGKLVFISNIRTRISDALIKRKNYIRPKDQNHFIWADFESVFNVNHAKFKKGSLEYNLLDDFKQAIRANGMRGRQIEGAKGNLYTNGSDAQNLAFEELKKMLSEIGFKAWRRPGEYTLRVNPEKSGRDPLLNPRFFSSGEVYCESLMEECLLVNCLCNPTERRAIKKISKLSELNYLSNGIEFREYPPEIEVSGKSYIAFIYIPLKFISDGNKHFIDWKYLRRAWEKIYDIVRS